MLGKNTTQETLPAFSIVGLGLTVLPTPAADSIDEYKQQNHQFNVTKATREDHEGKWGVLLEDLEKDEVGRVRIAGIGITKISGPGINGRFAEIDPDVDGSLRLQTRGSAQVLYWHPETEWAIIRIGNKVPNVRRIRGTIIASTTGANTFDQATKSDPHTIGGIEGIDGVWDGDLTIEIYNPEGHKLWLDCTVKAEFNETQQRWEVYDSTADRIVHGIQRNTDPCRFEKLDGASGWAAWNRLANIPWIKDVFMQGCDLVYKANCNSIEVITDLNFVKSIEIDNCNLVYTNCETEECDGYCTYEAAEGDDSTPENPTFKWVLATPCAGEGCECSPPPTTPPESLSDTAEEGCAGEGSTPVKHIVTKLTSVIDVKFEDCKLKVVKGLPDRSATHSCSTITEINLPFVTSVIKGPSALYYTTCVGSYLITPIGPCSETPTCGTITYEAALNTETNTLEWVVASSSVGCTSPCADPPARPSCRALKGRL